MSYILFVVITWCFAEPWEKMVDQITNTRAEIEVLSQQMQTNIKREQADVDLWSQKKMEVESQILREQMREKQLSEKLKRLESRIKVDPTTDPQGKKKLLEWFKSYKTVILSTIPFHTDKRLKTLADLQDRLEKGHESQESLLADFWAFLESEVKLSQSNDYRIVDVNIRGETKKCEVARLGLQALFVVTPSGQVLRAVNNGIQWDWTDVNTEEQKSSVKTLLTHLKNKTTNGLYLLPISKKDVGASL